LIKLNFTKKNNDNAMLKTC